MHHNWLLRSTPLIVLLLMLAAPRYAHAQVPECPADSSSQASGTIVGIASVEFPLDLAPCQTLSISVTTSDNHPWWGASFKFQLCNNPSGTCSQQTHTEVDDDNWSILNAPVTRTIPSGAPWIPPYRGTRGPQGLPVRGILMTTTNVAGQINYQVTISKVRRPDYNLGGTSTGDAPVVTFGNAYRGSIHPWEPGQYFRVHLEPGQGLAVEGTVLGHQSYGPYWEINVLDASQVLLTRLTYGTAYGGPFPFTSGTYLNSTNAATDVYLQFVTKFWPLHDFQLVVQARGQCPVPSGEEVTSLGWNDVLTYLHLFDQRLLPPADKPNASFAGRTVRERGTGGENTCHFTGSAFPKEVFLSDSTWPVEPDSTYGPDGIALLRADEILYYRTERPARNLPVECELRITQIMSIAACGGGETDYAEHLIRNMMDSLYLGVQKGWFTTWTIWP
jgi:hypothetical protein